MRPAINETTRQNEQQNQQQILFTAKHLNF